MVCSACGYENHAGMRFCGMCGMPLPHRPLTTPGAQSTLNYTRVPVESTPEERERGSRVVSAEQAETRQISPGNGSSTTANNLQSPAHSLPASDEPPAKELVPDISLDEYVQGFRYEPPVDSAELTMRGDAAPIVEAEHAAPEIKTAETAPDSATEEPVDAEELAFRSKVEAALRHPPSTPPAEIKPEPGIEKLAPSADSVAARLGLEPESPAEERVQRPRFLEINEPSRESKPAAAAGSGTSSIVGPSFLGLSDAPLIAAESFPPEGDTEDEPRSSHWRVWVAVAIVAIFVVLGIVQWRAQAAQSGTSPMQMIKAKLDSWRHGPAKPKNNDTTPPLTDIGSATSPGTQVPPPSSVQAPASAPVATNTAAANPATAPSAASQLKPPTPPSAAAAKQPSATVPQPATLDNAQRPPTIANSETAPPAEKLPPSTQGATTSAATSDTTPPATAAGDVPKPTRRADTGTKPATASGLNAPGAEEMSKAKNASDAAASAAWLWKATAKGNPDAPVQLADMYMKGTGVPRSCEQAVVLLKTAAAKENALARNRLASMYATGNCVQRNRVEAYRWVNAALTANPDSQWAQQNRELIWNQMTPDEQAAAQKYR